MNSTALKFRWVQAEYGSTYQLREVGQNLAFASVSVLFSSNSRETRNGYRYNVYVMGSWVASSNDLQAAKMVARELAEVPMATRNSKVLRDTYRGAAWE